ncbi:hypothetical protein HPP92_025627 [Vanilla planifolia]|uniref:Cytochrome P450 n=1 Tax=Vanilla planifolia TaxID=51239 RepID=A0A835PN48_VANPL|nr:hypothetical protein HPP92_025627 [Vanilla planifolia]
MDLNIAATVAAVVTAIVVYCAALFLLPRRHSPPLPPGPTGLPVLGSLPFLPPDLHAFFARLSATYGPIFSLRLGSKLAVVVSSPSLAKAVLRDHDPTFANRDVPDSARTITYGGIDIVWTPLGPTWRMLRRVCVRELFSPAGLDSIGYLRRREVRAAVRRFGAAAEKGEAVDVGQEVFLAVLNVIASMMWSEDESGEAVRMEFRELVGEVTELLGRPNVSDFFPAVAALDLQGIRRKMRGVFKRFDGFFERKIERKRAAMQRRGEGCGDGEEAGKDFLESLLTLEAQGEESDPFTVSHVKALLMDMIVGGTDTTANTIEFTLAEMLRRPETIRRAQAELDEVVGDGEAVEESLLPRLHYLSTIIKETLRLHPGVPLLVPHCPTSTCTIGGYSVPAGSRVFVNAWAIHRDPALWENPSDFRPERFAAAEARKWDGSANNFVFLPFGSGRRMCAGTAVAERMMTYSLASLLHAFDWRLPEGEELDLSEKFGIVLKKAKPLRAIPAARLSNPHIYS